MRPSFFLLFLGCLFGLSVARAEAPVSTYFSGFVQNKGQWHSNVLFATELPQGWFFLEKGGLTYSFYEQAYYNAHEEESEVERTYKGHAVRVEFVGANPKATVTTHQTLTTLRNYFIGRDQTKWATNVPTSEEVHFASIFPKTDLKLYARGGKLKYDFVVQPRGEVASIKMKYKGAGALALQDGKLLVKTSVNEFSEERPYAYQEINGVKKEVPCAFTLDGEVVGFAITGAYDPALPLVIDPEIIFVSYTGSSAGMSANSATADPSGNTYAAGQTFGSNYPITTGAYQTTRVGSNIAISKFNPTGTQLLFATYLGGTKGEYPLNMLITSTNELLICGVTSSSDFPISAQSFDKTLNNGTVLSNDFFLAKLSTTGNSLRASTYLGGNGTEGNGSSIPAGLTTDRDGNVLFVSSTTSPDFPLVSPLQNAYRGAFDGVLCKFNPTLSTLLWSTYLGGNGTDHFSDVKVGPSTGLMYLVGNTTSFGMVTTEGVLQRNHLGGKDGYLMVYDLARKRVSAATYLGTSFNDIAQLVALDENENVYVAGFTAGSYPVTADTYSTVNGVGGHFVHKMNKELTTTIYSTHLGNGNSSNAQLESIPTAFAVDACGGIFLTAYSVPGNPITPDAFYPNRRNLYLCQLSEDGKKLVYGSFFGGTQFGHVHMANHGYITQDGYFYHIECASGKTVSATPNAFSAGIANGFDGIITKFRFEAPVKLVAKIGEVPSVCAPATVRFENLYGGPGTFTWTFSDGSPPSNEENPTHTFQNPGKYQVQLTVDGTTGCSQPTTAVIEVVVLKMLEAPNIITPNGDGKNDVFTLKSMDTGARLKVYNRWGTLVYKSDSYANDWGGGGLVEGTYYYTVEADFACKPLKGWVEIIR